MKTISSMAQAKNAEPGVYRVEGAIGVTFRKVTDTESAGAFNQRYWLGGKRCTMSLGPLSRFKSLTEVQARSRKVLTERDNGVDPIVKRNAERAANLAAKTPITFAQAAEAHLAKHASAWKHQDARRNWFNPVKKYGFPILGDLPVNDIVAEHVAAVVSAAAADGNLDTGKRVQQRIGKIINAAIARGWRDPQRGNPAGADLVGAIVPLKRDGGHFRRIAIDDAPAAFRALQEARAHAAGLQEVAFDAWTLMIACSNRPSEALLARWPEFNLEKRLWTVPKTRMKSNREHIVPLSPIALEVLDRRERVKIGDRVFAGISYSSFAAAPEKAGLDLGTPHSWRSVFSDWRGNETNFPRELAEFALAHLVPGVAGDYQRESAPGRRVELMAAYARWLSGDAADVIAFPAPARA